MKLLSILLLFLLCFHFGSKAQLNKDSVFLKQMNLFKNELQLSTAQYNNFKTVHIQFQNKANSLIGQTADTITLKQKFIILKKELKNELKIILRDDQYLKYKEMVTQSIQAFKKEAAKNKIQVTTVDAETEME